MMDPISAFGFAANILQFVDWVCHLAKLGSQLRRNGMTDANLDLESSAKLLQNQSAKIRLSYRSVTGLVEADQALNKLAEESMEIADQIISFIDRFRVEKDLPPKIMPMPQKKPKSQDEVELEGLISSTMAQIQVLKDVIEIRKKEERKENERKKIEAKRKKQEAEKQKKEEKRLSKSLAFKLIDIVAKRFEYADEAKVNLDDSLSQENQSQKVIEARKREADELDDRKDMGKSMGDMNEISNPRVDSSDPMSQRNGKSQSIPKHPDEIELKRLVDFKIDKENRLRKLREQTEILLETEKTRTKDANEKASKLWDHRRGIKTLAKAIELEWQKPKQKALGEKLDRIRNHLYSEVLLNIHASVKSITEKTDLSNQLLEGVTASQQHYQTESQLALQNNQLAVESVLASQTSRLLLMDEAARKRHESILQAISSFVDTLKSHVIFPALPGILTEADPSLNTAAQHGYEAIENAVLAALYFRKMDIREAQVQEAFEDTFSWIFKNPSEHEKPWSKAGCGKSTLMKFLRSDARTKNALKTWTGSDELITASYFFWMAGTALQKNQEGLLRSLLHTILLQRRDLIARVFPKQYNAMMVKLFAHNTSPDIFFVCDAPGCSSTFAQPKKLEDHQRRNHSQDIQNRKHNDDACGTLTLEELKKAFTTLARQNLNGFKICLFIDGLDEYFGNQLEIVELFKSITSSSSRIKAVVSSRPEAVFVEAFHSSPKLRVENLTAGDIDHYIRSKLLSHSKMQSQMHQGLDLAERLVESITSKACGVFLWVFLVVRLLFECLSDGTYPEDLHEIVETYPEELHELYEHMFRRMKPSHKIEAFKLFQAIHLAQKIESEIPTALRLSFMERNKPDQSINSSLEILTTEALQERLSSFESRLRSRCCGFFEVQYFDAVNSKETSHIPEGRITYLHRTVAEFLNDSGVRGVIEREALQFNSEIYERLLASILYSFKSWGFFRLQKQYEWKKYIGEIRAFLVYCQLCETQLGSRQTDYIDEMDNGLAYLWQIRAQETRSKAQGRSFGNYKHHWAESPLNELNLKLTSEPDDNPLLSLAARYGASIYVCQKVKKLSESESNFLDTGGRSLLLRLNYWAIYHHSLRLQSHVSQ